MDPKPLALPILSLSPQPTVLASLAFLYLPSLPDLISASPPTNPSLTPSPLSYAHDPSSSCPTRFIKPTYHTSRLLVFLAQSFLIHRSKTFGGSYKIVAFLDFRSNALSSLPIVLLSRWGRSELMDPWKVTSLGRGGDEGSVGLAGGEAREGEAGG